MESSFFFFCSLFGSLVTVERGSVGRGGGEEEEEEEERRDQPAKQESFSLLSLTVLDVGRAEALLKLFGGEF